MQPMKNFRLFLGVYTDCLCNKFKSTIKRAPTFVAYGGFYIYWLISGVFALWCTPQHLHLSRFQFSLGSADVWGSVQ
jgi:hypothetical protein